MFPLHAIKYLFNRAAEKAFSNSLYFIVFKIQNAKIHFFQKSFSKDFFVSKKNVFLQRYPLRSLSNQTLGFCFIGNSPGYDFSKHPMSFNSASGNNKNAIANR